MRFREVSRKLQEWKRKKPLEFQKEEKEAEKIRAPRVARTGEKLTQEHWDYIMNLHTWDIFERKKLEIMRKRYPNPVTPSQFREEFGGKSFYVMSTFASINQKFRHHEPQSLSYRVEGEGEGFQVFIVASLH